MYSVCYKYRCCIHRLLKRFSKVLLEPLQYFFVGVSCFKNLQNKDCMNFFLKQIILFVVSLIIVVSTLFILSAPVENKEMLSRVSFGYPFPFLSQDFSSETQGLSFFPDYYYLSYSLKDHTLVDFSFLRFSLSFCIVFLIIELIIFFLEKIKEKFFEVHVETDEILY